MILVTGATGHLGGGIIRHLVAKGVTPNTITAMVRSEEKAAELRKSGITTVIGDYNSYDSMLQAFKGIDKLVLVSGSEIENRSQQHINAVNAAAEAGVKHVLYTSFERKNESDSSPIAFVAKSHMDAEEQLKRKGLTHTIFRNNLYADLLPMFMGEKVLESGVFFPAGTTPVAFTLRDDMAEAIANVVLSDGHENKVYGISSNERLNFAQVAKLISEVSGKEVQYLNPENAVYQGALKQAGVPEHFVAMFAGFAEAMKQGEFDTQHSDLSTLLQREPLKLKTFLAQVYGQN